MRDLVQTFSAPARFPGRKVHFLLADSLADLTKIAKEEEDKESWGSDLAWYGGHTWERALQVATEGDESGVPASDELLEKMEQFSIETPRGEWKDSIAGFVPNVPAFLAGHPGNMRRRVRVQGETAPMAVVVDLSTSAGLGQRETRIRGAGVLALVRYLAAKRPVELWVIAGLDAMGKRDACFVGVRVETLPLDLSHAAHVLTHIGFPRRVLYGIARAKFDFRGNWPFNKGALTRGEMEECLRPMFPETERLLALPGLHLEDESVRDPEGWLRRHVEEGGEGTIQ